MRGHSHDNEILSNGTMKKTGPDPSPDLYLFLAGLSNAIISNLTEKKFAGQSCCPIR